MQLIYNKVRSLILLIPSNITIALYTFSQLHSRIYTMASFAKQNTRSWRCPSKSCKIQWQTFSCKYMSSTIGKTRSLEIRQLHQVVFNIETCEKILLTFLHLVSTTFVSFVFLKHHWHISTLLVKIPSGRQFTKY